MAREGAGLSASPTPVSGGVNFWDTLGETDTGAEQKKVPEGYKPPALKASVGGAETIIPNIAKTVVNAPLNAIDYATQPIANAGE